MKESAPTALAEHMNTMLGYWVRQIAEEAVESFVEALRVDLQPGGDPGTLYAVERAVTLRAVDRALTSWREGR